MIAINKPITVYLDQNKWIDLSRAYYGMPGGEKFTEALNVLRNAVDRRIARFPISAEHVIETIEHGDADRRKRLAYVMAEFSRGLTIASKEKITPFEMEAALAKLFNRVVVTSPPATLGLGMGFLWGVSGFSLLDNGLPLIMRSIDEEVASELEMQANLEKGAMNSLMYLLEETDESLRKEITQKYNTDMKMIAEDIEKVRQINRKHTRATRYLAYAASMLNNPQDVLYVTLSKMGLTFDEFLGLGRDGIRAFYQAVPTLDTLIELSIERDAFHNKPVSENDATDISFLSVVIPYCEVVVTEKFWASIIEKKKLNIKYNTIVVRNLDDLGKYLATLSTD